MSSPMKNPAPSGGAEVVVDRQVLPDLRTAYEMAINTTLPEERKAL
jgi:hypothetical protein